VELILIRYGLLAVFVAEMFEADVIPVLAGVAAHRGYFNPVLVVVAASFGALAGDCVWFYRTAQLDQKQRQTSADKIERRKTG
jgi:membrane protein DedA with SNARE-associated domain